MESLQAKSTADLLALHAAMNEELRARKVMRSANNPAGDLGEYLFCEAFRWARENNSAKSFDARGADGTRYQIKARRLHRRNKSRVLGAIRDLDGFDQLAAVLFDDNYRVLRAVIIPVDVVRDGCVWRARTNSHRFQLRDNVWDAPGVVDATGDLRKVEGV